MATSASAITPPDGYTLEQPPAAPAGASSGITPPPGYAIEGQPAQPSATSRFESGVKQSSLGTFGPPQDATEHVIDAVTGGTGAGLVAWRSAKALVDSVQKAMTAKKPEEFSNARQDVQRAVQDFHNRDYRNLASDAGSLTGDAVSQGGTPGAEMLGGRMRELSEGARPGGDLATPLGKTAGDVITAATPSAVEGAISKLGAASEANAATHIYNPKSGVIEQIRKGEGVAQAPAQSALRGAAGAGDSGGVRTLLDEPIQALAKTERATYDALNKASGTDLKSLYDHAEEVRDALDDPTNIAQKTSLQADLKTTQDLIQKGESQAVANGVDPGTLKQAEAMTQKRYAMQALKQKLFNNESVVKGNVAHGVDETINVDSAIRQVENLDKPSRFAPEGSPTRLQQARGKEGAAKLKQGLYDAQKAGKTALSRQELAKTVGKWVVGGGAVLGAGKEIVRALQ